MCAGHVWIGCDISPSMLEIGLEQEVEGDLVLQDMGDGLPFRPGTFDGVVSISAVQWLCNADKAHHVPRKRMRRFFRTLYNCLTKGGRAALQVRNPRKLLCWVHAIQETATMQRLCV